MKAILLSVRPEHALNILNGKKTLELRKSVPKGFKGWVYVYVTKGKPYLLWEDDYIGGNYVSHRWTFLHGYSEKNAYEIWGSAYENEETYVGIVNGLVIMRFWFDEYIKTPFDLKYQPFEYRKHKGYCFNDRELKELCLNEQQLLDYGKGKTLYAWHIKRLEIFPKAKELGEFQNYLPKTNDIPECLITSSWQILHQPLTRAPQKMAYVWVKEE
jgi:hypothetical protein